uniref:Uncharacterized protein n=1 Tax=Cacopsylla melanoneura TaxID=428564 RepID=A0A8D8QGE1_9HEMI
MYHAVVRVDRDVEEMSIFSEAHIEDDIAIGGLISDPCQVQRLARVIYYFTFDVVIGELVESVLGVVETFAELFSLVHDAHDGIHFLFEHSVDIFHHRVQHGFSIRFQHSSV